MRDNESMIKCQWCGETQDWCACGAECPDDSQDFPDDMDIPEVCQPTKLKRVVENDEVWVYGEVIGVTEHGMARKLRRDAANIASRTQESNADAMLQGAFCITTLWGIKNALATALAASEARAAELTNKLTLQFDELLNEQANAAHAESQVAALHARCEGLAAKWRKPEINWQGSVTDALSECADELDALLAEPDKQENGS